MASLKGWSWEIAAGAGCGDGWCSSAAPAFQIEALRRQVASFGGQLMVLLQTGAINHCVGLDRYTSSAGD